MQSLMDSLNKSLADYGFNTVNFRTINDKSAKEYMIHVLKGYNFPTFVDNVSCLLETMGENRAIHTVYTFALGLLLAKFDNVGEKISNYYFSKSKNFFKNVFPFVWAITSILHDIGYFQRQEEIDEINIESVFNKEQKEMTEFIDEKCSNNIVYKLIQMGFDSFANTTDDAPGFIFSNCYNNKHDFSCHRYPKEVYLKYYDYRKNVLSQVDHGIYGGAYAFKYLIYDNFITMENENERYLIMDIAYKIMDHNIWKANDATINTYKEKNLFELIGDNFKLIEINQEPLLFLLCLADTIEFTKRIGYDKAFDKLFTIDVDELGIEINLKECNNLTKTWIKNINDLGEWMELNIYRHAMKTMIRIQ